ncbi:HAD family hydrolase [Streptomyces chartreusis]|jgi:HAD superfamily hydrolase (TIGR01549 family)|uniref:HAD family hydrolase n=1 Tax=Streptomyces chartreusis TaxID=1969 RepID=UPI0033F98DDE
MTARPEPAGFDDDRSLRDAAERIVSGRCVLFDFDGPLCLLFPGRSSAPLADDLRRIVARRGASVLLSPAALATIDPQVVLRAVDMARPGDELVAELNARLIEGEVDAAQEAPASEGVDDLVRRLAKEGVRIAVTTNNSSRAVAAYLRRMGLEEHFAGHIYGRTGDPRRLKPHPDCLHRALTALDADPADALMIGDTTTDLAAARAAGVMFVAYAPDEVEDAGTGAREREVMALREAGAPVVRHRFDDFSAMIPW